MNLVAHGVDYQLQPEAWRMILICGLCGAAVFAAGLAVFVRQDLNG